MTGLASIKAQTMECHWFQPRRKSFFTCVACRKCSLGEVEVQALRAVDIGHRTSSEVEILRGVPVGTTVVIHPSNQLADGVEVELNNAP
jgi:hypothetical protein